MARLYKNLKGPVHFGVFWAFSLPVQLYNGMHPGDLDDNSDPARLALLPEAVAQRLRQKYGNAKQFLSTV
jgi:hypothetical protein